MCGIAGFIDFNNGIDKNELENGLQSIAHRGPDDADTAFFQERTAHIGFGHRRLSILDVSSLGHQPMFSKDGRVVIILNGEIYNFMEIRTELEKKGYVFQSNSDTEVVLNAYLEYGISCLKQFIGMFAIALFDQNHQKVYFIRDRAGIKPLYYHLCANSILFGSELKVFHAFNVFEKTIDHHALALFFTYGYIKAPQTIFQNTYKLMPGHFMEIDLASGERHTHCYWRVSDAYRKPLLNISEPEAIEELNALCLSAFQYRMVSDVPVGVFLSGGYDSSFVTALLQKNSANTIKTFTIGFKENEFDESGHAAMVAKHLGTDHHEFICTTREAQEIIPTIPYFYDEPFGDSSAIPTMLVSRFARQSVTVSLSADGGDEIFAGYNRYDQLLKLERFRSIAPEAVFKMSGKLVGALAREDNRWNKLGKLLSADSSILAADLLSQFFFTSELNELLIHRENNAVQLFDTAELPAERTFLDKVLLADYQTYMVDDILTKVDRATMSVGLEGREPLLDHRIIEFVAALPNAFKYRNGEKKYLLKKMTHELIPKSIMDRPKMGFGIPFGAWMRTDIKEMVYHTINESELQKHGLLNTEEVIRIRESFMQGNDRYKEKIWLILMFQLWWNQWMK